MRAEDWYNKALHRTVSVCALNHSPRFDHSPLDFALRDCDVRSVLVCGVATEIGIEPTVRHAADLGYVPVVIEDACGAGEAEAGERALESLRFMGDALFTTVEEVTEMLRQKASEHHAAQSPSARGRRA